jgi:hypothetical protein
LVTTEDGRQGLMVTYTSGGVTPGDTYLWLLNKDYMPTGWKMWVRIVPIGGVEVSWENWTQLRGGVWLSTKKAAGPFELNITDLSIEY